MLSNDGKFIKFKLPPGLSEALHPKHVKCPVRETNGSEWKSVTIQVDPNWLKGGTYYVPLEVIEKEADKLFGKKGGA